MSIQHTIESREVTGRPCDLDIRSFRRWLLLGAGSFATLNVFVLGGLVILVLMATGVIVTPVYWDLQLLYWTYQPNWTVIALAVAAFVLGLWVWAVLQALFLGVDPPEGIAIDPEEAPELFAVIERVATRSESAGFDAVIVDGECNAAVVACPTFGIFGPMKATLVLGLPLLDAMDRTELPTLVAHEAAHLTRHSGPQNRLAQRVDAFWKRIDLFCAQGWLPGGALVGRFSAWYLDGLGEAGLRLSRRNELEADAVAAATQGAAASATVILRSAMAGLWYDRMWECLPKRIQRHSEPRFRPFDVAPRWFRRLNAPEVFNKLANVVLVQAASRRDTHPSWHERVSMLGSDIDMPKPVVTPASRTLGARETGLRRELDAIVQEHMADEWASEHESMVADLAYLGELEQEAAQDSIEPEEYRALAHLTRRLEGAALAVPHYRSIVATFEDDAEMLYGLGEVLLALGDEEGLEHIDRARALDPGLSAGAISLVSEFLASRGHVERARAYCSQIDDALDEIERAGEERVRISKSEALAPHGLDRAGLRQIADIVGDFSQARRVWLARKKVERLQARPCLVMVVEYRIASTLMGTADTHHECLMAALSDLPFDMFCIRDTFTQRAYLNLITSVPGALLFERGH